MEGINPVKKKQTSEPTMLAMKYSISTSTNLGIHGSEDTQDSNRDVAQ